MLTQTLVHSAFSHCVCGHYLFIYSHQGVTLYDLVYVDDIMVTGSSSFLIHKLINPFHAKFAVKKLGSPKYFLGIKIKCLASGNILPTLSKYISDLLAKSNISIGNGVTTPMLSRYKLRNHDSFSRPDSSMYNSMVGAIHYVTLTHPNIAFSVNKLCQYMASSLNSHWAVVKCILRYLSETLDHYFLISLQEPSCKLSI